MNFVLTRFHLNLLDGLTEKANLFCPNNIDGFNLLVKDAKAYGDKEIFWEKFRDLKLFIADKADCLKFKDVKSIPSTLLGKNNFVDLSIILSFSKDCTLLANKKFSEDEKMKSFIETCFSNYISEEKHGNLLWIGLLPSIVVMSRDENTLTNWKNKL